MAEILVSRRVLRPPRKALPAYSDKSTLAHLCNSPSLQPCDCPFNDRPQMGYSPYRQMGKPTFAQLGQRRLCAWIDRKSPPS